MRTTKHMKGLMEDEETKKLNCLACNKIIHMRIPTYRTNSKKCYYCGIINYYYFGKTPRQYTRRRVTKNGE